jgi:penicillin-binding protein 2
VNAFRDLLRGRFAALGVVVLVVLGGLVVQLWTMQLIHGATYSAAANNNRIRQVSLPAVRGRILDVKGRPLVTNRPVMVVNAAPGVSQDATLVARLATTLGMSVADINKRLASYKVEPLAPRALKVDVSMATAAFIMEHAPDFPGITIDDSAVREYPGGSLAAHVLGYTGEISSQQMASSATSDTAMTDIVGKTGVEASYDKVLQGEKGFQRLEVDNMGRVRRVISEGLPRAGKDIRLTIDRDVQKVAEQALTDAIAEAHKMGFTKAHAGAAVVLDVNTGGVVAMASAPTYDPATFLNGISGAEWKSLTATSSQYPLNNRAISGAYPPGSTFKAVVAMAGLQDSIITPSTSIYCPAHWTGLGAQWAKWNWDHVTNAHMSLVQAIEQSNDSYFYEVGKRFYQSAGEKLQAFARSFGFGALSGIDLGGEVAGRVPDAAWKKAYNANYPEYQQWLPGDTVNMAIGQGDLLVTPLQLADYYAALGNGGRLLKPHVLQAVLGADGAPAVAAVTSAVSTAHLSAANLATLRTALVGVTTVGTGAGAMSGFPVAVAGKTGTAQMAGKDDYAWFACYAPASHPKYAVVVTIEQGGHGGSVAEPAARQILSKLFSVAYHTVHATDVSR